MGIAFSHWDVGIPHGMFHAFRRRLAEHAGIPWDRMADRYEWEGVKLILVDDPLVPLLRASEVEAAFAPAECLAIKRRLQELAEAMVASSDAGWRQMALDLAHGMALAAFLGEEFAWSG